MPKRETPSSNSLHLISAEEYRRKLFAEKAAYRSHLAKAPIIEKLRILEEMRDFTSATRQAREQNKALMASAWTR